MRQVGSLTDEKLAQRFADHLLSLGVRSSVDHSATGWTIWAFDEDQIPTARQEFAEFQQQPDSEKYLVAAATAAKVRDTEIRKQRAAQENQIDVRKRWEAPTGNAPFTWFVIGCCVLTFSWSHLGPDAETQEQRIAARLLIAPPTILGVPRFPNFSAVRAGEVWRLVTPVFLHSTFLHILMNLLIFHRFGLSIEIRRGTWRLVALFLAIAIGSNVVQYAIAGPMFGGMSGVNFGLFGYLWMKTRYEPRSGLFISQDTVQWLLIWLVFCLFLQQIANGAHFAGFAIGLVIGIAPTVWKRLVRSSE